MSVCCVDCNRNITVMWCKLAIYFPLCKWLLFQWLHGSCVSISGFKHIVKTEKNGASLSWLLYEYEWRQDQTKIGIFYSLTINMAWLLKSKHVYKHAEISYVTPTFAKLFSHMLLSWSWSRIVRVKTIWPKPETSMTRPDRPSNQDQTSRGQGKATKLAPEGSRGQGYHRWVRGLGL